MKKWLLLFILTMPCLSHGAPFVHSGHDHFVFSANTTYYIVPGGILTSEYSTEAPTQVPYGKPGTFSQSWSYLISNTVSSPSSLILRVNGVGVSTITLTASTVGAFQDVTLGKHINADDLVNWKLITGASGSSLELVAGTVVFAADSNSMMKMTPSGAGGETGQTNGFANFYESIANMSGNGGGQWANQTESNAYYHTVVASTVDYMAVYVPTNARTVTVPFVFRMNGADTALAINVAAGQTGLLKNTTSSVFVPAGSTVTIKIGTSAGSDGNLISESFMSTEWTTNNNTAEYAVTNIGKQFGFGGDDVTCVQGPWGVDSLGTTYQIPGGFNGTVSHLHFSNITNTLNGNANIYFRRNGARKTVGLTRSTGTVGYIEDTVHVDTFSANDLLDYEIVSTAASSGSMGDFMMGAKFTNTDSTPVVSGLTYAWGSDGGDRIPREKFYPHGATSSSTTISRSWDGRTISVFSGRGQTIGFDTVLIANTGTDMSSVTVVMSSMTCDNGSSIVSVPVSSFNVTDTTQRPIQEFSAWYVQNLGMSTFPWGHDEYEERMYPLDLRVPYTVNGNDQGSPVALTDLWAIRPYHDLYLPIAWVPEEEFLISSETIHTGNSKTYHTDIWISSSMAATQCHGVWRAYEDTAISTAVPVELKIYNVVLPNAPSFQEIAVVGTGDIGKRFTGSSSPSQPFTGDMRTALINYNKMLKAHNMTPTGDAPDITTNDFPSGLGKTQLDGTMYSSANGYGNARGVGQPDTFYFVGGPYTGWANNPRFSSTDTVLFCAQVSSWSANLSTYSNLKAAMYGQDEVSDQATNEKWAHWLTSACVIPGTHINMFITADLTVAFSSAPNARYPVTTNTFGNANLPASASSQTWQNDFTAYNVGPDSAAWRYNQGAIGQGANDIYEEEGYVQEANYWGMWKKLCPGGVCRSGHFQWYVDYYYDVNQSHVDNDLFNVAKTFGFDIYPSTSAVWGHYGNLYSQGDGVWFLPGKDLVYANPSFGFLGPIATLNAKKVRDGINDVDILNLAYAVNPASTTALVQSMYSLALWEKACFTSVDCSYAYGDRTWLYGANTWTVARERALMIAERAPVSTAARINGHGNIKIHGKLR